MDEQSKAIRRKLRDDFEHYAAKCLRIRSKSGEVIPLLLNKPQRYLHAKVEHQKLATKKVRVIIVKGRQEGCSTYIEGRFYWLVTHRYGYRAFILTHDIDATNNLFEMAQRYHEHCPIVVRPTVEASNAKELIFGGLDSGYRLGTAGNKSVGRSSTIQLLHASEVAYWPNVLEHAKGIMQTVPNEEGTEIFIESTANGAGNYFHQQWQMAEAGISDYMPIFIPWFWMEGYRRSVDPDFVLTDEEEELKRLYNVTDEQLIWRRYKIIELSVSGMDGTKAFMQEYPCTSTEAFQMTGEDNFFSPHTVMIARKCNADDYGNLVIGCDPARYGDDRTSIIRRKGRKAFKLESYVKKDTMEVAGLLYRIIVDETPKKVFIDIGGLGAGVYDRLIELGFRGIVVAVNGSNTPLDQRKYRNKRSETWGLMREWMIDQPAQIPDVDSLHADLCGTKYKFDSKDRLLMEDKDLMKKRGIRSPDEADALALTFALPGSAVEENRKRQDKDIAKDVRSSFTHLDKLKKAAYGK